MPRPVGLLFVLCALVPTAAPAQPRTLDLGDARINYVVAGEGPAVVLLHGWALSLREWDDQVRDLSPHYRVIALDRRGYGKSTGFADPTADPGDVRALLDTLGIRRAVLVGHSGGADVAMRFAAAMPDRVAGLVLYGGPAPEGFPIPEPWGAVGDSLRRLARQYGLDSLFRMVGKLPGFVRGPHRTAATEARLDSIVAGYDGRDLLEDHPEAGTFPEATLEQMRHWTFPTLFISGDQERPHWGVVTDSLARWMPNAKKVVIAGGGHGIHFDEPAQFDAALLAFLDRVFGAG